MFADRGLELIVSSTNFYSTEAYNYDEAAKSVELYEDGDKGIGVSRIMTYEEYRAWVDQKLTQTQELVNQSAYSAEVLERERSDYEDKLEKIRNGATLTMTEFEDVSYSVAITYSETEASISRDADGSIILGN